MTGNKAFWNTVRESDDYKFLRDLLIKDYNGKCAGKEIPMITFSDEMEFVKTGNRTGCESKYNARREQLGIYVLMALIYPEKEEYLQKAEDVICEICSEFSWQLPAHRRRDRLDRRDGIDLFAAETGMYLAEIKYILGDRLNPLVCERISNEIDFRILKSFEREEHWFETLKSNWAAVCGCGVGVSFMYEAPERFLKQKKRIDKCMANYLDGITDEGATSEGISYWRYGFSFFVLYHDALRRYTNGGVDEFKNEKVRRLAEFCPSIMLDKDIFVSFSDSCENASIPVWLIGFLKKEYGIDIMPFEKGEALRREISGCIRDFLYYIPDCRAVEGAEERTVYYKELEWYIAKKHKYGFAVKGGNNGEEHNHNDIGSFIVVNNGKQVLCDLGAANYNAAYFGAQRYSFLNTSSLGHSVPVVNGQPQSAGKEYCGVMSVSDNRVSVDMKKAYPADIKKLERRFELTGNSVILTDSFDESAEITERFVTETEPAFEDGTVLLYNNTRLKYNEGWKISCSEQYVTYNSDTADRRVYLIDFKKSGKTDNFTMEIVF